MSDPIFILLKDVSWLPRHRSRDLLGSIVINCLQPLQERTPLKPSQYVPEDADPLETDWDQFTLRVTGRRISDNYLSLEGLFGLRGTKTDLDSLRLQGKRVVYKRLIQQLDIWEAMMADENIKVKIDRWTSGNRWHTSKKNKIQPYWVVGMLTCQDVTVNTNAKYSDESTTKLSAPVGALAEATASGMGYPIKLDGVGNLDLGHSSFQSDSRHFAAQQSGAQVFALQVKRVVQKGAELKTSDQQPDLPAGRTLAHDEADEDTFESEEMDEEDWQELLMSEIESEA